MTYWQKRAGEAVNRWESMVNSRIPELIESFEAASKDINNQIMQFYARYAAENKITLADAQKALSAKELREWKGNLKEYEKLAKNSLGTYNLELENMSIKARVTRLQALQFDIDSRLQALYQEQKKEIESTAKEVITDSYYHAQYDLSQSPGHLFEFAKIPDSFIIQVLREPVLGADISTRLWRQDIDTGFKIRQTLNTMFATGRPPQDFAEELQKVIGAIRYDKNGSATGTGKKYEAYRLLYNEAAHAAVSASDKAWADAGIDLYQIVETLDGDTCPICRALDNCVFSRSKGGEVPEKYRKSDNEYQRRAYEAKSRIEGINSPLFHVNCRGSEAPFIPDLEDENDTRIARDPDTGKSVRVPDISYEEWKKKYVDAAETIEKNEENGILNKKEMSSIIRFIGGESYSLNAKLREHVPLSSDEIAWVETMDSALNKLPKYEGLVTRDINFLNIHDLKRFAERHKVGSVIKELDYTSATTEFEYLQSPNVRIKIQSKTARDVRQYNEGEQEVIFPRNTSFKINSVNLNDKTIFIYAEEAGNE